MRRPISSSIPTCVLVPVLFCALVFPGGAQANTIGSVAGLYQLALSFVILFCVFVGASLFLFRRSGWTLRKDWWRMGLLLLASLFGAVFFSVPLAGMIFG